MTLYDALILGLVQGLTEFIPVSSSGHLILARELLGIQTASGLAVDAVLQLATMVAVLVYFRKEIFELSVTFFLAIRGKETDPRSRTLLLALILGTIPAVLFGLMLERTMETLFRNPLLVAGSLVAGAVLFLFAEYVHRLHERARKEPATVSLQGGFIIGLFQSLALIPGLSRSGMTISGGLFLGLSRVEAARFGFLLSFPIILGSGMKKLFELGSNGLLVSMEWSLLLASLVACVSGLFAIRFMLTFLKDNSLVVFALYRFLLAALVFWYFI